MRHLFRLRFRRTTLLTASYVSFLGGVGLAHRGFVVSVVYICGSGLALIIFRHRTIFTLLLAMIFGISLGIWRGSAFVDKLALYKPLYGQQVTLVTRAMEDAVYGKKGQLSFTANQVMLSDGTRLAGHIQVSGFGLNSVYQGDEVQVTGKLRQTRGAYQGKMSYGKFELIGHHLSPVADIRRRFAAGMQSTLPEPLAPFAMGLLIGQRATLPEDVKDELTMVGLTHIIAVSGYNLTIILQASKNALGRTSKRIATFLALALIAVFLLLAGTSASIVRAAIVSVLSIAAAYYGRSFNPRNLIMLVAAITVWANPLYVWSDIGWYLSFLAFYGVMVLAPAIGTRLRPNRKLPLVTAVALESICAEIMTAPFILHIFGQISLIGLPANVLVVTMVPLAMLLSLIAGLAGMFSAPIAGWLAWPAGLLLTYMLDIAHILSRIPHIFIEKVEFNMAQMLALYSAILLVSTGLHFKTTVKNAKITDKDNDERTHVRTLKMVND